MAEERQVEFAGGGVIKKCPNCGAQIEAFQVRCPVCGFAISGESRGGSASLKTFLDMYSRESDGERKTETVRTFPIPNTIEDIIEFSLFAFQQIKSITSGNAVPAPWELNLCAAWYAKLDEARLRASLSFSNNESGKLNFDTLMGEAAGAIDASRKRSEEAARIAAAAQEKAARRKAKDRDKTIKLALKVQEKAEKREAALQLKQAERQAKFQLKQARRQAKLQERASRRDAAARRRAERRNFLQTDMGKCFVGIGILFGMAAIIFVVLYITAPGPKRETQRLESLLSEIQANMDAGKYDIAEMKLVDLQWKYSPGSETEQERVKFWQKKQQELKNQIEKGKNGGRITTSAANTSTNTGTKPDATLETQVRKAAEDIGRDAREAFKSVQGTVTGIFKGLTGQDTEATDEANGKDSN